MVMLTMRASAASPAIMATVPPVPAAPPKSPLISPQHRHSIRPRVLGVMVMVVLQAFAALLATMDTALFILVLAPPPGP
jgi:hypothetical protein